jgi:histidine triad (HIT) family protein
MTSCLFCEIVAGEQPAQVVHADETAVAFLDTRPVFPGHVLVVPRTHVLTLTELPAEQLGPYFARVQLLTAAVESGMQAQGTFVAINNRVSQSVAHLHTHVVPRRKGDGLRGFFWPRTRYGSDADVLAVADAIRAALAVLDEPLPDPAQTRSTSS